MKWRIHPGKIIFIVVTLAALALVVALSVLRKDPPPVAPPQEQSVAVTVIPVTHQAITNVIRLPAQIEPVADITISAEQAGRVTAMNHDEGDTVAQGEVLLTIDDRVWKAAHQRARLAAQDARRDLTRLRELHASGGLSQSALEAAETRADTADLALSDAAVQLEKCSVTAPADGRIEMTWIDVGEYVNPGQALFRLLDTRSLNIVFDVSERDITTLQPGRTYRFTIDPYPGEEFEGTLSFVAAAASPANNAFRAELRVQDHDGRIRPGMIARVHLTRGTLPDAILLPLQAIVPLQGETVVYVADDGHAIRRIVRLGDIIDGHATIIDGLRAGDQVILDGNRAVLDGTPVKIVDDWQPAPPDDNSPTDTP